MITLIYSTSKVKIYCLLCMWDLSLSQEKHKLMIMATANTNKIRIFNPKISDLLNLR